jgi:hypothetical protein
MNLFIILVNQIVNKRFRDRSVASNKDQTESDETDYIIIESCAFVHLLKNQLKALKCQPYTLQI